MASLIIFFKTIVIVRKRGEEAGHHGYHQGGPIQGVVKGGLSSRHHKISSIHYQFHRDHRQE